MKIIDNIHKLFRKKAPTTIQNTDITRYDTSSINLPSYSELSKKDKEIVDGFISEIDLAKLDTLMLYSKEITNYANANTDLLVKLFDRIIQKPFEVTLRQLSQAERIEKSLDSLIQREQINLYRQGLQYLQKESSLRATALVELGRRENKRKIDFLGLFSGAERLHRKSQMELLQLVTEQMKICTKTVEQQTQATTNAMQNASIIAASMDICNVLEGTLTKEEKEFYTQVTLRQRVNASLEVLKLVLPEESNILNSLRVMLGETDSPNYLNKEQTVKTLAIAQRKLDIYAYTHHKKDLEQLRQEVLEIGAVNKTFENRGQLLARILDIQKRYKVFTQYLKPEDLETLYQTKYTILTTELDGQAYSPFKEIEDKEELDYYTKIIEGKLEKILTGNNAEFLRVFGDESKEAIRILKKIITSENGDFSGEKILLNKRILMLIHSFDIESSYENKKNGFGAFICSKNFDEKDLAKPLNNVGITWEDKLPLKTIHFLELVSRNLRKNPVIEVVRGQIPVSVSPWVCLLDCSDENFLPFDKNFEKIYLQSVHSNGAPHLKDKMREKDYNLILPEGIKTFSNNKISDRYEKSILEMLCLPFHTIHFPSSLHRIVSDVFLLSSACRVSLECCSCLKVIGDSAFESFAKLPPIINLPASLESIGNKAFKDCENLQTVNLPASLQTIGDMAFYRCWNLQAVNLPASLQTIGNEAFKGCVSLQTVKLPTSLLKIENVASSLWKIFSYTNLTSVEFTDTGEILTGKDLVTFLEDLKNKKHCEEMSR